MMSAPSVPSPPGTATPMVMPSVALAALPGRGSAATIVPAGCRAVSDTGMRTYRIGTPMPCRSAAVSVAAVPTMPSGTPGPRDTMSVTVLLPFAVFAGMRSPAEAPS